ncbi:MAG: hypothetical protein KC419_17325 [Anaerolineales bacterium]|nr:hypothetical protein [Anaerolineales bacterium]
MTLSTFIYMFRDSSEKWYRGDQCYVISFLAAKTAVSCGFCYVSTSGETAVKPKVDR